jgi:hypothetical protein
MSLKYLISIGILCMLFTTSSAQTSENSGWLFLSHTQKLSNKFDLLADFQLRSANKYDYWKNVLSRTALNYNFSERHSIAIGYVYLGEWEKAEDHKEYSREHRVYGQYQVSFHQRKKEFNVRGRFEQRFVKEDEIKISQRARIFASLQAPLVTNTDFTQGLYFKLQNELFLNVQNKDDVNGSLFDQNRPYVALGFRASKKLDFETGYMRLVQRKDEGVLTTNTIQVMITTNF